MGNFLVFISRFLFGNSILHNISFALIYVMLFDYLWENFEAVYFAYMGVIYVSDFAHRLIGYFFAIYPIIFYRGLRNASSWVSVILYYFGYVPVILGLCLDIPINSGIDIYSYYVVLSISMSLFFLADRRKIVLSSFKSGKKIDEVWIWRIIVLFILLLFVTYAGNIRLVNFKEIYQLREENAAVTSSFMGYVYSWCANFFFPFVFCYGLIKKSKFFIVAGSILFVFLFSIMGQKSDVFAPVILFILYRVILWQDKYKTNVMGPISLGLLVISIYLLNNLDSDSSYEIAGLLFSRTLGVGAYHVPMYLDFFKNHPYTYFSHINIINAITNSYPYSQSIGEMVAGDGSNSNAIFWLMDGVASCGVWGVGIISFIVFYFLMLLNGICNNNNKYFVYTIILMPMVALVNVSFFTTVLSKGILFIFLTIGFVKISLARDDHYERHIKLV